MISLLKTTFFMAKVILLFKNVSRNCQDWFNGEGFTYRPAPWSFIDIHIIGFFIRLVRSWLKLKLDH